MNKSQAPSESKNKTKDFFGWMDGIKGEEEGIRNYLCCADWSGFVVFRIIFNFHLFVQGSWWKCVS
jgi:hypothetical protein